MENLQNISQPTSKIFLNLPSLQNRNGCRGYKGCLSTPVPDGAPLLFIIISSSDYHLHVSLHMQF